MWGSSFIGWFFFTGVVLYALDSIGAQVALDTTPLNTMLQFDLTREAQFDLLFISFSYPIPDTAWFQAVMDVATFNQWLLSGWAQWIRLGIFLSITAGTVGPLLVFLFSAILSAVRSRLP